MTPASPNPWITTTSTTAEANQLDMSPTVILERDRAIRDGIRSGIIGPSFAMRCRAAVAAGIASGIVTPAKSCDAAQGILEATTASPVIPGGRSKV